MSLSPSLPIITSEFYVQLAVDNVVKNACKYANTCVRVSLCRISSGYELKVEDDGKGLDEFHIEKAKQAFVQVSSDVSEGFGLGLAIVGTVMVKLDGKMAMSSSELGGLEMVLILPAKPIVQSD